MASPNQRPTPGSIFAAVLRETGDLNSAAFAQALISAHPGLAASFASAGLEILGNMPPDANAERQRIASRLQGFNPKDNPAWATLKRKFGPDVWHPELVSIASVLSAHVNIPLDRDAKRRKSVLLKWFEENWGAIAPFIDYVRLVEPHEN